MTLLPYTNWTTKTTLGSDHLPILITCSTKLNIQDAAKNTYINFKKADWNSFKQETEDEFNNISLPTSIYKGEKTFRKILLKCAKHCIPQGKIKQTIPNVPTEATVKMKTRDDLRMTNPNSPEIAELNFEIENLIKKHRQEKWKEEIEKIDRKSDPGRLFKFFRNLNGQPTDKNNSAIKFKNKYLANPLKIANGFNKQYTSVVKHTSSAISRKITKDIKKNKVATTDLFTNEDTTKAIKKCKTSKAIGPDGLSNLHIKHIGPKGINYLTTIFNLSFKTSQLPSIWKTSIVIPLAKPGKDPSISTSYRPVSLLCPAAKIMERLILPILQTHLPIPTFQHGF